MFDFKWKENGAIKLLIIVGTRPEIIRLAATIKRCREYFDCCVAHTGQNYDKNLNDIFWSDFELGGPDVWMNVVGENLGQTCGNVIARSYELTWRHEQLSVSHFREKVAYSHFPYGSRKQM